MLKYFLKSFWILFSQMLHLEWKLCPPAACWVSRFLVYWLVLSEKALFLETGSSWLKIEELAI